jgi:iron complex outermembrane receptor protein
MTIKSVWRAALLASAAAVSVSAPNFALAAADAPAAAAADKDSNETVVVTARRRDEALKDVPVAVSAFSAQLLDTVGARNITDLGKNTPNATIEVARGTNSTLISYIRGVGQQDPLWGFEPGVGLYVDDVYYARPQAAVLDIFDVKDIEVLRGPQGTLYGRNTIGGAIKYSTARIGDTPELFLKGTVGTWGEHDEQASFKLPLDSKWAAGGAVAKFDNSGWGKNLNTGVRTDNRDVTALRGTVEFKPTDTLFFRLNGDRVIDNSNANNGHRMLPSLPAGYLPLPNVYNTYAGAGDKNTVSSSGVSFLGQWTIDDKWTGKSITAYRNGRTDGNIDFDDTPQPRLDIPAQYRDRQFTQEFQLNYAGTKLHAVGGLFFLDATAQGAFDSVLGNFNLTVFDGGYVITKSIAAYVDGSYDLTDRLQVSLGGRWTSDEKTGHVLRQTYLGIRSPYFGNSSAVLLGTNTNYQNKKTFDKFTPKVSATYKLTSQVSAYGSISEGFKSGGFDMRGDATLYPNTVNGYRPETVTTYELGLKGSLFQHRLAFSTAIFDSEYKDQQITTQYPTAVPGKIASVVDNIGSSTIKGFEFEGTLKLLHDLSVTSAVGLLDTKFNKYLAFIPGSGVVDVSSQRHFAMTPKTTAALRATWTHDYGHYGRISVTPSASLRSNMQIYEVATPLIDQKGYGLVNADVVWTSESGRYEVALRGKNILDERYRTGGYNFPGALYGNSVTAFYGAPARVTLSASARF